MTSETPPGTNLEPTIVAAHVAAGHDGQAEISLAVRYSNGAVRDICYPLDAIGPVLDAAGISTLDALVGQPWTILIAPTGHDTQHPHPEEPDPWT